MGDAGAVLILIMLFMAIVSTGSAESIAVSSLVAYDIYREYINPEATGKQILFWSRVVIVLFNLFMGFFAVSAYDGIYLALSSFTCAICSVTHLLPFHSVRSCSTHSASTLDGSTYSWALQSVPP